jgi:hypothetical protein
LSDQDHVRRLIVYHTQRLQKLKEQQALSGLTTDPKVLIEIEEIEIQLAALRSKLAPFESKLALESERERDEKLTLLDEVQVDLPPTGLKDFGLPQTTLLQCLYKGEQRVLIEKEFGGGFGGTRVLLVRPINRRGRQLARQIVKIGPPHPLRKEQRNYDEHVGKTHPFVVAQVTRYAEWQGLGGIIYNFVGDSRLGDPRTLEEYFQDKQVSATTVNQTLEDLLDKALGQRWYHETESYTCFFDDEYGPHLVEHLGVKIRLHSEDGLWAAAQAPKAVEGYYRLNSEAIPAEHAAIPPETLVQLDGLVITKVKPAELKLQHPTRPGIVVKVETLTAANYTPGQAVTLRGEVRYNRRKRLAEIVKTAFANFSEAVVDPQAETLTWGDKTYPNPLQLYPKILSRTLDSRKSLVHGDLHLRNILVDEAGQGWLIDFALVKERHNLYDFIKLETYLRQMALSQSQYEFSFAEYLQFEAALLGEIEPVSTHAILRKAHEVIRRVRDMAKRYVKRNFDEEYLSALFLYNLAMLKYAGNHGTKAACLAFGTAGVVGKIIDSKTVSKEGAVKLSSSSDFDKNNNSEKRNEISNKFRYHDIFTPFEIGLEQLGAKIGQHHSRSGDFHSQEGQLLENIRRSRRFGNTAERRAERAEVIDQLNELALSIARVSFNELCRDQ